MTEAFSPTKECSPIRLANCADLIVFYLRQLGVEKIFGVPGGAIEPLCNALAQSQRKNELEYVVARHECGAAFMADGYHRESGKMGVVCVTTGPGTTNLMTGVSSAMAEHIPLLVITAQTALPKFGRGALQESSCTAIDTVGMMRHCTQFTTLVSHPEQLESKLISAIMAAHRNPKGPVHLSIPSDILNAPAIIPERIHADLFSHDFEVSDDRALATLYKKVNKVDTIAVFIDAGVASAAREVVRFCELVNAPFVVGQTGKYWVDETHPLYRGVYGFAGHQSAREVFTSGNVDLVIAVGSALRELSTAGWDSALLNTKLVHIDSNAEHFTRSPMANHHVCGNIRAVFNKLNKFVRQRLSEGKQWLVHASPEPRINELGTYFSLDSPVHLTNPWELMSGDQLAAALSKKLPKEASLYIDAGNSWAWMTHYFVNRRYNGKVKAGMEFGAMAWAAGASIGAALANPNSLTFALMGDGAYLMSAQELTVAAQRHLPVVFIVLNDSALGMVMHGQRLGKAESIGWELPLVDFAKQAESMGVSGIVLNSLKELEALDFEAFEGMKRPVLLDVRVNREVVPPIGQRVKGLNTT